MTSLREADYKITFINPAFSPSPSYWCCSAPDEETAIRKFWERTNPNCVVRSIGNGGIVCVDVLGDAQEGGA